MSLYYRNVIIVIGTLFAGTASAQGQFCCTRHAVFVPIEMPARQESDATGMIGAGWYGALREAAILDCPIQYEELSYDGRQILHKLINDIGEVYEVPPDPEAERAFTKLLDCEYGWKATLSLNSMAREVKGWYDEDGYNEGYIEGNWTLNMQLVNLHFEEVVREGQVLWDGSATNVGGQAIKALVRSTFSPIDDIMWDYEHIPWNCSIELEVDSIEAGKEVTIDLTEIRDDHDRAPLEWQRVVVEVAEGELLNGTLCSQDGKKSAFLVGTGDLHVQYRAPQRCEDKMEKITVYNSCDWGQEWVRPLRITMEARRLAMKEIKIYDRKVDRLTVSPDPIKARVGEAVAVNLTDVVDVEGKPMEPHERIMVRANNGTISNGMPKDAFKVFEVGQGRVTVLYQAPDDFSVASDTLWIHNACIEGEEFFNIVPGDLITRKPIEITAPPIYARITRILETTRERNDDSTDVGGIRTVIRENFQATYRVTIYCTFEEPETRLYESGFELKPWGYTYPMKDCRVMSSTYTSNASSYHATYHVTGLTGESLEKHLVYGTPVGIDPPPENNSIELRIDTAAGTGLIHRVSVPYFDVTFSVETHKEASGKQERDGRLIPWESTDTFMDEVDFPVQPLIHDRDPCKKVTGGDGLHSMTGRCTETRTGTYKTERETFQWAVYVKKE